MRKPRKSIKLPKVKIPEAEYGFRIDGLVVKKETKTRYSLGTILSSTAKYEPIICVNYDDMFCLFPFFFGNDIQDMKVGEMLFVQLELGGIYNILRKR